MNNIVFSAYSSVGTLLGTVSVDGIIMYGTDFYDEAINQAMVETADGGTVTFGNSIKRVHGVLAMNAVSQTQGMAFRTWLRNTLQFQANYAGIALASAPVDLGNGSGVDIAYSSRMRYIHSKGDKISKIEAPLVHVLKFEYSFKR